MPKNPRILILAGSVRAGSYNQQLADAYAAELVRHECEVTRILLSDYPMPIMDEDLEREKGVPPAAEKLTRQFDAHDAIVIVGPEYNGSITPLLKNTIDWVSRLAPDSKSPYNPYKGKLCAVASASNGAMGGYSSLTHLRHVLVRLGMLVISEQLALGGAASAFDEDGRLTNDRTRAMLEAACSSLVEKARLLG